MQQPASPATLVPLLDRRIVLIVLLALLAGILAYQAPPTVNLAVGWLGDQLFLAGSEGQSADDAAAGLWFGDELTEGAPGGRSRWTRERAVASLPGLGSGGDLSATIWAQGWPSDVINTGVTQPQVTIYANDVQVDTFQPQSDWQPYTFRIPTQPQQRDTLRLTLVVTPTFAGTQQFPADPRQKGIRVANIAVHAADARSYTLPALLPLALLVLNSGLLLRALLRLRLGMTLAFVLAIIGVSVLAIGLAIARVWTVTLLPWISGALLLALLAFNWRWAARWRDRWLRIFTQGATLNYGLIAAAAAWMAYVVARLIVAVRPPDWSMFRDAFPDSLLLGLLGAGLLVLLLVYGRDGLPRVCNGIVAFVGLRWSAALLLAVFLAVWLGYEASIVATMRYVGHADYADNAVVARNLLRGRGWVVDYVTQFYQLNNGITRPQQTWPLLQPVWIVLFFALFGVHDWVAKIPNLLFTLALGLMIYTVGARLWDRRVGLVAAALVLTNSLFFYLVIYTTSDLAFTVFAFGALWLLYRGATTDDRRPTTDDRRRFSGSRFLILGSGLLTGLMLLQKPGSGVIIAFGMGLWFLAQRWRNQQSTKQTTRTVLGSWLLALKPVVLWVCIALVLLSPYLIRNTLLFGTPFYSTESRDAWVWSYVGDTDDIYKVYTTQDGLGETGGLPDRSWLLRWGFDRVLSKVETQTSKVRDYLLPPWLDQSLALSAPASQTTALLFGVGAWLALLGLLGALRSQRRLLALLFAAFVPYILFLCTYWHADEERYFVLMMPWMALLAAYTLWRGYDRIAAIGDGRWTPVGFALVLALLFAAIQPSWPDIDKKLHDEPVAWQSDLDAYAWLRDHTQSSDVIMTRVPWQLNWASERPALMIPNTLDRTTFMQLARYYRARYIVFSVANRPTKALQDFIDQLAKDGTLTREYSSPSYKSPFRAHDFGPTFVYSFSTDYDGVSAIKP